MNIEQDLANILSKLDSKLDKLDEKLEQKLDKLEEKFEQRFDKVEQRFDKVEQRFDKVEQRFDKVEQRFDKLEIGQAEIKGEIKALDTKTDQLEKRVGNQEFAMRGVLIGRVGSNIGRVCDVFLDDEIALMEDGD